MKIPAKTKEILYRNVDRIEWFTDVIRRKEADCEFLPEHLREKSTSYYIGMLCATYTAIEEILMAYNCYAGFRDGDHRREYDLSRVK